MMNGNTVKILQMIEELDTAPRKPATVPGLAWRTGLSETTVRRHLRVLEAGGFIHQDKPNNRSATWRPLPKEH